MHFYSGIIDEHKNNQKMLFSTVDKMLHRTPQKLYPTSDSVEKLTNGFADFFESKITKIRSEMITYLPVIYNLTTNSENPTAELSKFSTVSED